MPPSAGACQTIDADPKPDCGRAGKRSSIITAIGCRRAASGVTSRPVNGAGTSFGDGVGVGDGEGVGARLAVGSAGALGEAEAEIDGSLDGGAEPSTATRPDPAGDAAGVPTGMAGR